MPHLFSRFHHDEKSKTQPTTTTAAATTTTGPTVNSAQPLQPAAKNRTVGPEVSKMKEWDWAGGNHGDKGAAEAGTGTAFVEDMKFGMASPKSSVVAGMGIGGGPPVKGQ